MSQTGTTITRQDSTGSARIQASDAGVARRGQATTGEASAGEVCPRPLTGGQLLQSASAGGPVLVDWLEWTIPVASTEEQETVLSAWESLLGEVEPLPVGGLGYTMSGRLLESGRVFWSPARLTQGVHVRLSGSALALLPEDMPVDALLGTVVAMGGRFTRLDLAIDSDVVTMAEVSAALDGELVTRAQQVSETVGRCGAAGHTIYVGSRKGRRLTRFYDKAAEQGLEDGSTWTRCEVEHRAEYAHLAALHLLDGRDPADLIVAAVDFRRGGDDNVSRRDRSAWWADWLGGIASRASFAITTVQKSVEQVYSWLKRQVAPSLALLAVADPEVRQWVHVLIEDGFGRLPGFRLTRARLYRERGGCLAAAGLVADSV